MHGQKNMKITKYVSKHSAAADISAPKLIACCVNPVADTVVQRQTDLPCSGKDYIAVRTADVRNTRCR